MKNSPIISAFVGAGFTALSGIGLGIAWPISIPIGVVAFGASELLFSKSKSLKANNKNLYETLQTAKAQNQEIYNMIRKVEPVKLKQNIREINETATKIIQTVEQIEYRWNHQDEFSGVETGFYDLDHLTSGLQPSTLNILAARPAMGKPAFALNIAQHVGLRTDKAVAIFSLEMSESELMKRILASESEVPSDKYYKHDQQNYHISYLLLSHLTFSSF